MSARRPAEDAANGHSDKKAKVDAPKPAFDIAAIRAQIAAKKAALEAANGKTSSPTPAPSASPAPAAAATSSAASSSRQAGPASLPPTPQMDSSVAVRLAAAKARIEALNARSANPYLSGQGSIPKPGAPTPKVPVNTTVGLHPLLMQNNQVSGKEEKNEKKKERERYKPMAPKFSTVKANAAVSEAAPPVVVPVAQAPSLNPYASASTAAAPEGGRPGARRTKQFQFSKPGRYVQQGDQLRNEEKMEALRLRIAEASRKAGLDSEFDTLERSLKVGHWLSL